MDIPKAKDVAERQQLNIVISHIKEQLIDKINKSITTSNKYVAYRVTDNVEIQAIKYLKEDFEKAGYEVNIDVDIPTYTTFAQKEPYCTRGGMREYTIVVSWLKSANDYCNF